jgi:hypothetical protein
MDKGIDKCWPAGSAKTSPSYVWRDVLVAVLETYPPVGTDWQQAVMTPIGQDAAEHSTVYSRSGEGEDLYDIENMYDMLGEDNDAYDTMDGDFAEDEDAKSFSSFVYASEFLPQARPSPSVCSVYTEPLLSARAAETSFQWSGDCDGVATDNRATEHFSISSPRDEHAVQVTRETEISTSSQRECWDGETCFAVVGKRPPTVQMSAADSEVSTSCSVAATPFGSVRVPVLRQAESVKFDEKASNASAKLTQLHQGRSISMSGRFPLCGGQTPTWLPTSQTWKASGSVSANVGTRRCSHETSTPLCHSMACKPGPPRAGRCSLSKYAQQPTAQEVKAHITSTTEVPSVSCTKGHPLVLAVPKQIINPWLCDGCQLIHESYSEAARFRCALCDYDLCESCHSSRLHARCSPQPSLSQQQSLKPMYIEAASYARVRCVSETPLTPRRFVCMRR